MSFCVNGFRVDCGHDRAPFVVVVVRRGFTIRLKRLNPRAPEFGGPQNFGSKDDFQHFCKQLYLYFCFGSTHVFYYAANKRSV